MTRLFHFEAAVLSTFTNFLSFFPNSSLNRIEEAKRAIKRPLSTDRYDRDDDRDRDRKRSTREGRGFEVPPPPPRFETTSVSR